MKNLKTLIKYEFLRKIYSYKFFLMIVVTVIVSLACVYVQVKDFEERQKNFFEESRKAEQLKDTFRVFSEFKIPVIIRPNPLSVLAKGHDENIGNKIIISPTEIPEFQTTSQKRNPFLDVFVNFDLIAVVQIIFTIMTIFIVADTISGEREEGTLKLLFSNNLSRFEYFLSKYAVALIIVTVPLIISFLVVSLVFIYQPFIALNSFSWIRLFLILSCCWVFLSLYILIALIISAKTASGFSSVIYSLLLWIALVFIYPNTIDFMVYENVKVPSIHRINAQITQMYDNLEGKVFQNMVWPERPISIFMGIYLNPKVRLYPGYPDIIGVTQKYAFEAFENAIKKNRSLVLEELRKIQDVKDDYNRYLYKQKIVASIFLKFLPGHLLEQSATKIANTDYGFRRNNILIKARAFRNVVIQYLESKDAFGLNYFTQMKREEMKEDFSEYDGEIFEKYGNESSYPLLNLKDIPAFSYSDRIVLPLEITLLFILNIILFILGLYSFHSSNLTRDE